MILTPLRIEKFLIINAYFKKQNQVVNTIFKCINIPYVGTKFYFPKWYIQF